MTEQTTNAELIELAQDTLKRYGYGHLADAVEDQAAALEAAEKEIAEAWRVTAEQTRLERERAGVADQRAAELAAVVEKVRAYCDKALAVKLAESTTGQAQDAGLASVILREALATAPADALRELKADVWDEGYKTSEQVWAETADLVTPDEDRTDPRNPYREEADRG